MVGDGLPRCDTETAPAFALCGFEALEEVQEGKGGGASGGRLYGREFGEGCGLSVFVGLVIEVGEVEERMFT